LPDGQGSRQLGAPGGDRDSRRRTQTRPHPRPPPCIPLSLSLGQILSCCLPLLFPFIRDSVLRKRFDELPSTCGSQLRSCARLFKSTGLSPLSHAWPYIYKSRAEYPWAVMVDTQLNCYVLIIRLWTARHGLLYQRVPTTKRPHGGGRRKHRPVIIKHQAHHGTNSSLRPTYLIHE